MGKTAPDSFGSIYLYACQALRDTSGQLGTCMEVQNHTYAAVGPVSHSPSPTTTGTIKSGLSMTAPNATARAYPSSPPSWIDPGTSAFICEGNPLGVENPAIRFLSPIASVVYRGKNLVRDPSIQSEASIAGAPWPIHNVKHGGLGPGRSERTGTDHKEHLLFLLLDQ